MTPHSDMETMEHETANCEDCGQAFHSAICRSPFDPQRIIVRQRRCEPCIVAFEVRIATEEQKRKEEAFALECEAIWEAVCPKNYRLESENGMTNLEMLQKEVKELPQILAHPYGHRGLILRGGTGTGKTRSMYRLLRSYHVRKPRPRIIALSSGEFDRQARDAQGTFKLTEWFQNIAEADILYIDDIGKGKWTASTASQFWEIVDDRTRNCRPIFITTNCSGDTLVQSIGLSKDIGEPLLRRLRENCKAIVLQDKHGNS